MCACVRVHDVMLRFCFFFVVVVVVLCLSQACINIYKYVCVVFFEVCELICMHRCSIRFAIVNVKIYVFLLMYIHLAHRHGHAGESGRAAADDVAGPRSRCVRLR